MPGSNKVYDRDLARIHDLGFSFHSESAFPYLLSQLKSVNPEGLVIELGCGSGIVGEEVCKQGYNYLGVDLSKSMIDLARERLPDNAELLTGSIYDKSWHRDCFAVCAFGECFNYCFDRHIKLESLSSLFSDIYNLIYEEGFFLFDMALIGRGSYSKSFWNGKDWYCLSELVRHDESHQIERRITTFVKEESGNYRKDEEQHLLQLFEEKEVVALLENVGFEVELLKGYEDGKPFPSHLRGFMCRKRPA